MRNQAQMDKIKAGQGFIAALDQSGGSTPKALRLYGVEEDAYSSEAEMYDMIHAMRSRIAQAPAFTGDKVVGAILFEMTMDREIAGKPTATYMWEERGVVPFLKVDKGLADEENGVQLMKPMPELDAVCERAVKAGMFGTKMRSVINAANEDGIKANVAQQFEVAKQIMAHGLVPIIEPEINISISDKAAAEDLLLAELTAQLNALSDDQTVMLKLTLPETANQYKALVDHPRIAAVVALSGGYSRAEANERLSQNTGMIASFSRALTEGLSVQQSDAEFNTTIADTIDSIYQASIAG
ncbi:fructose bisphosphate aldolase [Aliiroseovarius sp. F47248L]|uniref:fructose bisphosphate aldolase n=1 Tax=Aliiroseovarius sp. F47248L TaxID=2926420 RepID=UPI001FF5F4B9|nr:fructose bisphosphate aldolase [Aliiroseovarius sp. F47248L]MCK0139007.1 fructose bisphosphate aldolase [Aliiroseovarius sp. F47248L]